jgi:adenylate cyclase
VADWTCATCRGVNPAGHAFCGHCGARRGVDGPDLDPGWSCRSCGTRNASVAVFCGGCGQARGSAREEEVRLVTALFVDISGFTTLADALDTEGLHEVVTPLIGALTAIAEKYDGFVEKFAGDALLAVFGVPATHEDDPQRALLTALEMHERLPQLLRNLSPSAAGLTLHAGVNTGRVIGRQTGTVQQSDYAVLGDSVILAQRLESVCPPGQTYVGPLTHELAQQEFDFETVGALQLKGKLKTVEAFRLVGRRRTDTSVRQPIVGRGAEMTAVEAALDQVSTGRRTGVLAISGEPGAGKSRLLAEARKSATRRDFRWLVARCLSYGSGLPYWPLVDLLRHVLGVRADELQDVTATRLESTLPAETVPAARRLLGLETAVGTPEQARREIHDTVAIWLRRLAATSPVVLVVEDVHWADAATLEVLGEVVRTVRDLPLLLAVSVRPEGLSVVEALSPDAAGSRVEVGPLGVDAVRAVVTSVLGRTASPGLADLLTLRTGGNALFVEELTRSLDETGVLVETSQGWDTPVGWDVEQVPTTVERVLAARIDSVPPVAAGLLQTAAVIGRTTRLSLLRAVAGDEQVDEALEVLLSAGLLDPGLDREEPAVIFHHTLLQDVVYGRLLRKRRRELHRRVADVGRGLYGDGDDNVDLLARHLYLAETGDEAVEPLLRAGRRAASLWANAEAVVHLERALEVLVALEDVGPRRGDVELELAALHQLQGRHDRAKALYDDLRTRSDVPAAWAGLMAAHRAAGEYRAVLDLFVAAVARFDPRAATSVPIWAECANTLSLAGRFSDAVSMLRTQLRLRGTHESALRGQLLTQLAYAEGQLRLHEDAVAHADAAVELLEGSGDLRLLVSALRVSGMVHTYAGRPTEARQRLDRGVAIAERIGLLVEAAGCRLNSGLLVVEDSPEEAVGLYRDALAQFERIGHAAGQAQAAGNLAEALWRAGRLDEADEAADQALGRARVIGHGVTVADVTWTQARVLQARGSFARATATAEQAAELFLELDDLEEAVDCLLLAAQAAGAAGEPTRSRDLSERARALAPSG